MSDFVDFEGVDIGQVWITVKEGFYPRLVVGFREVWVGRDIECVEFSELREGATVQINDELSWLDWVIDADAHIRDGAEAA